MRNLTAAAALSACLSTSALAGGFYLQEQSPRAIGRAVAGEAAIADTPATIFFNPAGMTRLEGIQVYGGASLLDIEARQENQGTTRTVPGTPLIVPVAGGDGGNPFDDVVIVPSGYASAQITDRLWAGLGVGVPYGLSIVYDDDFFGRYDSLTSDLFTVNIQPSLAYKLTDNLSIGGGIDVQYADAELSNALPQLDPSLPDGLATLEGDDWSVSWNAGVLFEVGSTRFGLHYRADVDHELTGTSTSEGLLGPLEDSNRVRDARAPLTLPDILEAALVQEIGDNARVMGSVTWYDWSDFDSLLAFDLDTDVQILESPQGYDDTFGYSVGGEYDVSDALTVRAGYKFDETPTNELRTTRVPDGNRHWASAGLTYALSDSFYLDASYAHIFVDKVPVVREETAYRGTPAAVDVITRAEGTGNVDQIAIGIGARF